ncbi:rhomboid family intramembrane serine protease [Planctomicrobium sp. SH664]|uniref:rhomboid family intramembrane serine protease n=1 Tax=Planctomicrobium sp. SH664 TaxID=3448125 RepID=UPI003F5BDEB6
MIPLRDNIPSRTVPFVNYALVAICCVVFFMQLKEDPNSPSLVERYGMIPARIHRPGEEIVLTDLVPERTAQGERMREVKRVAAPPAVSPILTTVTCVFLHGSWMHLIGNMWFLLIFGDNIEDRFGHLGYLLFYLGCGAVASFVHYFTAMNSTIPTIGASGAIAGVMGAYFVWYPRAHVQAIVPLFVIIQIMVLPAPLFLGIWFLMQLWQGTAIAGPEASNVAWWAHIGGFAAGVIVAFVLGKTPVTRPANPVRRPESVGVFGLMRP